MNQALAQLSPAVQQIVAAAQQRGLALPALLLLAGHRPLAFLAGQTLAVAAPLAEILGQGSVTEWAVLLSDPTGPERLLAALQAENH